MDKGDFFKRNIAMITDFYEFTMANGYLKNGMKDEIAVFDVFFREIPDGGGFAIFAGLEQVVEFFSSIKFSDEDIEYFRSLKMFSEEFLSYLKHFKFSCDVWSVLEGVPIFPNEPIVTVRGPIMEVQLFETVILATLNHQSLIATKANRIVRAAKGKDVLEFGARRAHCYDAAVYGSRAAYIGGCCATSCIEAGRKFGIPVAGTMSHSFVQSFPSELEAFRAFARTYPENCTILIDTYSVLNSGILNAIKVFDEILGGPKSRCKKAVRIDSGDIAYFSKKCRKILDDAGYENVKIVASNSVDEFVIRDLIIQGAFVDAFAVGENLITSKSSPIFSGVYKMSAVEFEGKIIPKIKISESAEKVNLPGFKKVYRFFDRKTDEAVADLVALADEEINEGDEVTLIDPFAQWKRKILKNICFKELLVPIFKAGKLVFNLPKLEEVRQACEENVSKLWDEVKRFEFPHKYYVDLSLKLLNLKNSMLKEISDNYSN